MPGAPTTVPRRVPTRFLHGSYVPYNSCGVVQFPGQAHFKHTIMVPLSFEKVVIVAFEVCGLLHLRSPCPCTDVLWCVGKATLQEISVCSRDPQPHVCSYLNTTPTTFSSLTPRIQACHPERCIRTASLNKSCLIVKAGPSRAKIRYTRFADMLESLSPDAKLGSSASGPVTCSPLRKKGTLLA